MKNICLADGVYIYDCIEFNPRFRYGDVAADIDFLAMDLDFHGYRELSRYFVAGFARASRDQELLEILDFYKCYRAYVRGKINAFIAQDPEQSPESRERAGSLPGPTLPWPGNMPRKGQRPRLNYEPQRHKDTKRHKENYIYALALPRHK